MAVTGLSSWSTSSLTPVNVSYVHRRLSLSQSVRSSPDAEYIAACTADLQDVIRTATAGDVACLIAEPIQGVAGFVVPPDRLFAAMREVARGARDPVRVGRGADGLGPRPGITSGATRPTASRPTC